MTVATLPRAGSQVGWTPADRFSDAAQRLRGILDHVHSSETSVVLGERYRALSEAVREGSTPNWDGYGGLSTDDATFEKATIFLRALPTAIPDPEIGVEPSGQIAFEWYRGRRRVFTISVSADGDLSYAMLFGREKTHGSAYFIGEIPDSLAFLLSQFLGRKA